MAKKIERIGSWCTKRAAVPPSSSVIRSSPRLAEPGTIHPPTPGNPSALRMSTTMQAARRATATRHPVDSAYRYSLTWLLDLLSAAITPRRAQEKES